MKLHLSRWVCLAVDANLRRAREESERAVAGGAEIVVFPELFLSGYTRALGPAPAPHRSVVLGDPALAKGKLAGSCPSLPTRASEAWRARHRRRSPAR